MRTLTLILALAVVGCEDTTDDTGDAVSECPLDTTLDGGELPCTCGAEIVEELPDDGTSCFCDSVSDFTCV